MCFFITVFVISIECLYFIMIYFFKKLYMYVYEYACVYIWVHTIVSTWSQEEQLELQAFVGHLACYMGARIWTLASVLNLWSNSLATRRGLYIFYILSYLLCYVLFEETGFSLKFCIFEFDLVTLWWHFVYSIIHYVNCQFLKYILNMLHLLCVCVCLYICVSLCTMACLWSSKDNFQESVHSLSVIGFQG